MAAVVVKVGAAKVVVNEAVTGVLTTDSQISSKVKLWKYVVVLAVVTAAAVKLVTFPTNCNAVPVG